MGEVDTDTSDNINTNYLQLIFYYLGLFIFIAGILINYLPDLLITLKLEKVIQIFKYGRANNSKNKSALIKFIEVPKSWFAHFYLFSVIVQICIVYSITQTYLYGSKPWILTTILSNVGGTERDTRVDELTTFLVVSMFLFQVTRRLYETLFVSIFSGAKMNVIHYATAFIHYSGSMLSLISHSPRLTSNSKAREFQLSFNELTFTHILGLILFLYGSLEQYKAHKGFANLRKGKDKKIESYSHKIPTGGLFDLVSCPNYWAEIIIYFSFAVVFQFQNPTWNYVLLWVFANQVIAGIMNHKWYKSQFPNYPANRKAIIPYIW